MTKLYQKSELWFSIIWIIIYILGTSVTEDISDRLGVAKCVTTGFYLLLCALILTWIFSNKLQKKYGLCKPVFSIKQFLYFIPLIILISINFWLGIELELNLIESILYIVSMLCVGFIEEIIFRGFLFKAMEKDGLKSACIVSSVTFGIGHILNLLFNNANVLSTIYQICYSIAIGFLFVILFYKGKSLLPCIITHSLFNAFSLFTNNSAMTITAEIIITIVMIIIPVIYSIILLRTLPKEQVQENNNINQENNNIN